MLVAVKPSLLYNFVESKAKRGSKVLRRRSTPVLLFLLYTPKQGAKQIMNRLVSFMMILLICKWI